MTVQTARVTNLIDKSFKFKLHIISLQVVWNSAEIEELSGRLKASRQRVADLERNFTTASNSSQKNEKARTTVTVASTELI